MFLFPYSNIHELNLDWLLQQMIELKKQTADFININSIKYADPLQWRITTQYEANTVVINPEDSTAYLSVQPVPAGVNITNTEYWTPIGNFAELYSDIKKSIAAPDAGSGTTTPAALAVNDLIWWNNVLYRAVVTMPIGTALVIGSNIVETNISDELKRYDGEIGDVREDLQTETEARTEADNALSEAIQAEATARGEADTALSEAIQAEAEARSEEDNSLRDLINEIVASVEYKTYNVEGKEIRTKFEKGGSYQLTDTGSVALSTLLDTYSGFGLQSAEYIGQNRFLLGFSVSPGYSTSLLVLIDRDFNIINRIAIDLGHCNDLAYDSTRGKIYVATMGTGSLANTIAILNSQSLALEGTVEAGSEVYKISYDKLNDVVYDIREAPSGLYMDIREPGSLDIVKTVNVLQPDIPNHTSQGSVVIDGNFYYIDCVYGATNENAGVYFTNINPEGVSGNRYAFNSMPGDEAEGVTTDDENIYIFSYNYVTGAVQRYTYALYNNSSVDLNNSFTGYAKLLTGGEDLNNLVDGKYIKVSGSISVANWPMANTGGTIIQLPGGYDHTFQIGLMNNGAILARNRASSGSSGNWTSWSSLSGEVLNGYYYMECAGYIGDSSKLIAFSLPTRLYTRPNLDAMTVTVRNVAGGGYSYNGAISALSYTLALTSGFSRISLRKSDGTAFPGTNNTPVCVSIAGNI